MAPSVPPSPTSPTSRTSTDNSNVPTPELHYSHPQKTIYKPDLQILKRPTQSLSPTPTTAILSKQEEEALRIEREKKYEEARGRIFGTASPVSGSSGDKKVWEPKEKEKGVPIRGPKGPSEGKGFVSGRGRGKDI
jgi:SUZ domain